MMTPEEDEEGEGDLSDVDERQDGEEEETVGLEAFAVVVDEDGAVGAAIRQGDGGASSSIAGR